MNTTKTVRERSPISESSPEYPNVVVNFDTTPLLHYWDEFVKHFRREGKSDVTIKHVKGALEFIIKHCKIFTIQQCNNHHLLREALFEQKDIRNWKNITFNTYVKNINTYFIWLEDMDYVEQNKIRKIRKCKEQHSEQYTINEEQIRALFGHLRTRTQTRLERWRNDLFFGILTVTGARPSEVLDIRMSQVKESLNGTCEVCIKGKKQKGKPRYYKLPPWVIEAYIMYKNIRAELGRTETKLFVSGFKRTGWTYSGVRKLCKNLSAEIGFRVIPYGFRRFAATKLFSEGLQMKDIQNYMGHTRASTTMGYVQNSSALTSKGVDVMGEMF